jgi:hypothetical protein
MLQGTELQFNFKSGDGSFSWVVPTDKYSLRSPNHRRSISRGDGAITLVNAAVIGKVLTGYISGAGTVAAILSYKLFKS